MARYDVPPMSSPVTADRYTSPLSVRVVEASGIIPISPGLRVQEYIDGGGAASPGFRYTDGEGSRTNSPVITTLGPASTNGGDRPPIRNSFRQQHRLAEGSVASESIVDELESRGSRGARSSPPVEILKVGNTKPMVIIPPPQLQSPNSDAESGKSITVYPQYLRTPGGIFKIIEIIIAILICATVDASQCAASAVCGTPSGSVWRYMMGGQGFVLFVAIMFIFGNIALILIRIFKVPPPISKLAHRMRQGEILYNVAGAALFVIAGCVEAYYASWVMLNVQPNQSFVLMANQIVPNPFRPQWIAAAVLTWINAIIYAGNAVYTHSFEKD